MVIGVLLFATKISAFLVGYCKAGWYNC